MLNNIGLPGLLFILVLMGGIVAVIFVLTRPSKSAPEGQPYDYAGFWLRACAMLLDSIIIGVAVFIVAFTSYLLMQGSPMADGVAALAQIGIPWIYFAHMESSSKQATLGKMVMGIKVTDMEGKPVSFSRATGRFFGKFLSQIILLIGYFMAGWTQKKQALHDKLAGTLVVRSERTMSPISPTPAE